MTDSDDRPHADDASPIDRLRTPAIHAGEPSPRVDGSVTLPIFQSSTYVGPEADADGRIDYHSIRYVRLNNSPNHIAVSKKIAALEGTEAGIVTSSGMAAISTALLSHLRSGDHVLTQARVYGGTMELFETLLSGLGIEVTRVDATDPASWATAIRDNTRAFYCESIENPLLDVPDLAAIVEFSRANDLVSFIDNTFASPANFRPASLGFDVVLHSATKILNGHSDLAAGAILGRREMIDRVMRTLSILGGCLDPHACFLLQRGIKSFPLRAKAWNANGLALARFLDVHEKVERAHYPGLPSDPNHERARECFDGFGGMVSFRVKGGDAAARKVLDNLRTAIVAPSLGGTETLVCRPADTSHAGLSEDDRRKLGIDASVIRVSCGLESPEDLIDDFARALDA